MVFLTIATNALKDHFRKSPKWLLELISPSRLPSRNQTKRLGAKYYGRRRINFGLGVKQKTKAMVYSTRDTDTKPETLDRLYETRITAGCLEHGMDKQYFLTSIAEFDINLNRESLANLSIYEPRTFQTLVEFVKMRALELGLQSAKLGSTYGTESRGVVDEVKGASPS